MFRKVLAVTLAAIIMITPMTASAVTWGAVVSQLNASGSYSGEGVEASISDGAVTVQGSTGATIEGDIDEWNETPAVNIHVGQVDGVNKYSFQDVTFNDNVLMNGDGVGLEVTFGTGTTVNADLVEVGVFNGGTASFTNEGTINAELGSWGDTGSVDVTNNGTVNGNMGGGFGGTESGPTTGTVINNGTVTGNMNVYAFENGTATGVVGENGVVEGEFGGGSRGDATLTNNGSVSSLNSGAEDEGTTKVVNNGTVTNDMFAGANQNGTLTIENNGTISGEIFYAEARDDSSMTITNNGEIVGELEITTRHESTSSTTNNGHIGDMMFIEASQNATATGVNKGTIDGALLSAVQDWDEEQEINIPNAGSATSDVVNDGEVGSMFTVMVYGEGNANGINNGTVSMNINSIAEEGGTASATNNGDVEGIALVAPAMGGSAKLTNNSTISSVVASYFPDANGNTGTASVTGSGTTGKLTVDVYAAPDVDVSTAEARQKIADDVASGLSVYAGQLGLTEGDATVKVVIYDENGEEVDTVEAEVPLTPVPSQEEYKPSEWEIRHQMEEKRRAESLAGVFASPYWCRQLSLGYRSLNLWTFNAAGEKVLMRERLSWIDGGPRKNLNLRVRTDETQGVAIRFDEEVLDILERTEIDTITLLTYTDREPFIQYNTADLRAAFTKFGLARTDLLVVGGMDDEVMKIGADGKMVPVE